MAALGAPERSRPRTEAARAAGAPRLQHGDGRSTGRSESPPAASQRRSLVQPAGGRTAAVGEGSDDDDDEPIFAITKDPNERRRFGSDLGENHPTSPHALPIPILTARCCRRERVERFCCGEGCRCFARHLYDSDRGRRNE